MIVKHTSQNISLKFGKSEQNLKTDQDVKKTELDNSFVDMKSVEEVNLDIDIPARNAMCTKYLAKEEETHLEIIKISLPKLWMK